MNLAIDIGNTLAKLTIIENGQIIDYLKIEDITIHDIEKEFAQNPDIDGAVMIAPGKGGYDDIEFFLRERVKKFIKFDHTVPVPIKNLYSTPETLGPDRLAAAIGANAIYPDSNVLIVDFGTAVTNDFVSDKNEFLGGNISLGAAARFRALNQYTKTLPLCALNEEAELIGNSTEKAIVSGVVNGIVYEIEGYINNLETKYNNLRIIFTGGDGDFFAKRLKNPIFATYDLVAYGLNRILEYNAK